MPSLFADVEEDENLLVYLSLATRPSAAAAAAVAVTRDDATPLVLGSATLTRVAYIVIFKQYSVQFSKLARLK